MGALAVASTALSAYGAYQQGQYQGQVARNNATMAQYAAQQTTQEGVQREEATRQRTAQMIGQERAGLSAGGVNANVGSAARLQEDTANLGELDAVTLRNNAANRAWAYQTQAAGDIAQEKQDTFAGNLGSLSSLVGGSSSIASKYKSWQTVGGKGGSSGFLFGT